MQTTSDPDVTSGCVMFGDCGGAKSDRRDIDLDLIRGLISDLEVRTGESHKMEEQESLFQTSRDLYVTYMWVFGAIGIPGNIVIMATILRMRSLSPATFFTITLAACDCLALVSKFIGWILYRYEIDQGTELCKLEFFPNYFSTLANWVLTMISVERFISICYPLRKAELITNRRCYVILFLVSLILFVLFASIFSLMRDEVSFSHKCGTLNLYAAFWIREWFWLGACLYLVMPYLGILGFNLGIIWSLLASGRRRRQLRRQGIRDHVGSSSTRSSRTENMFTAMLAVASIFFLLAVLPAGVFYVAFHSRVNINKNSTWSWCCSKKEKQGEFTLNHQPGVSGATWELFHQISYVLVDSTHALNFFLYFLSAKRFRTLAIQLFCKPCLPELIPSIDRNSSPRVSSPLTSPQSNTAPVVSLSDI